MPDAHTALGYAQLYHDADWLAAESSFLRALEINPSSSPAYMGHSQLLTVLARHGEAICAAKRARELDPLSPIVNTMLAFALCMAGELEEALECSRSGIEMTPSFSTAHAVLGWIYERMGKTDEAVASYRTAVQHCPGSFLMRAHLARGAALTGDTHEATRILNELLQQRETTYVPCYWIALVYAALGQEEPSLMWLETAGRERCGWRTLSAVDPRLRAFAHNAKFQGLLREIGFPARDHDVKARAANHARA